MRRYLQAKKADIPAVVYFPNDTIFAFCHFVKSRWEAINCGVICNCTAWLNNFFPN